MNKFVAIALLACVCLARASSIPEDNILEEDSQSALNPTDSEELAGLKDKKLIFSDFCLQSRDYVRSDLLSTTNNRVADVFTLFFRSAEELGVETLNTQKDATERLGEQLRNPDAALSDADDAVEQGLRKIQQAGNNVPKSFFQAVISALGAAQTTVANGVRARLLAIQNKLGLDTALTIVSQACSKVGQYEEELQGKFAEQLKSVAEKDASLAHTRMEEVDCLTSKRIIKIDGLCKFAAIAKEPLMKMMTYRN